MNINICGLRFFVFLGLALSATPNSLAGPLATYGQVCRDTIGVPVPSFDCDDQRASLFNQGRSENGGCERPHGSEGVNSCVAGSKLLRYDDTFTVGGVQQVVSTVIFCRGTPPVPPATRGVYHDIAVIQINQTKNASCWFSKQDENPTGPVPSPNPPPARQNASAADKAAAVSAAISAGEFWGNDQPNIDCRRCHDNGLLIRTPAVSRVLDEPEKGYKRTDRNQPYGPGDGNALPSSANVMSKQGAMCSVGNVPWRDGRDTFPEIKINSEAFRSYNSSLPVLKKVTQSTNRRIDAGYCTSCHYVGAGFSCRRLVPDSTGKTPNPNRRPNTFPANVWMPPAARLPLLQITTKKQYDDTFDEPIAALTACCTNPNLEAVVNGQQVKVCQDRFENEGMSNILSQNGACALLNPQAGIPRMGSGGTNGTSNTSSEPTNLKTH